MSDVPADTPTGAARALIAWFAGALAFESVHAFDSSSYVLAAGYCLGAIIVATIDYNLKTILARSPRLTETLNGVASDARWWVGTAMVSLLVISISPYVEQCRWPYDMPPWFWLVIIVIVVVWFTAMLFSGRRHKSTSAERIIATSSIDLCYDNNDQNCYGITPVQVGERRSNQRFFRLRALNKSAFSIPNCVGVLKEVINIQTGENVVSMYLRWASGPSGVGRVILAPEAPMYIEICAINENNMFSVTTVEGWPFRHERMFNAPGEYLFRVTVGSESDRVEWKSLETKLHYTGDWQTSIMKNV